MVEVLQVETPTLGDRSYLAHDGEVALVVDPQRDIDRVTALAAERGVRIACVAETHIHNDYVTGGMALSGVTGASYLVNGDDPVGFDRTRVHDGDIVEIGAVMRLRVLATPGHTFTHLSYVLEAGDKVAGVFTGGSLLYGSTGRPDLLGPGNTAALARAQYASARRLANELPDSAEIFPTHGFGSFCAATQAQALSSTIGREKAVQSRAYPRRANVRRDAACRAGHVAQPTTRTWGLPMPPGPREPDMSPPRKADAAEVRRRIQAGEWVVDLRDRVAFAAGFVSGSFSFPLDGSFASYLGWVIPWGTPLTLLGRDAGAGRPGSAGAGADRNRPPGGRRDRAAAGLGRRPAAGIACGWPNSATWQPPPPPSAAAAVNWSCWMSAARSNGRTATSRGSAHPLPRAATAAR